MIMIIIKNIDTIVYNNFFAYILHTYIYIYIYMENKT